MCKTFKWIELLAVESQKDGLRSAHSNAVLDDSLTTVHTTSLTAPSLSAVVKYLMTYWS